MPLQVEELIRLQALDVDIQEMSEALAELGSGERERNILSMREKVADLSRQKVTTLQARQKDAELRLAAVEKKREQVTQKLFSGTVSNPKELTAMQQEVRMLDRQRGRLDEGILTVMTALEEAEPAAEQAQQAVEAARQAMEQQTRDSSSERQRLTRLLAERRAEREELAARLEPDTRARYEDLLQRHRNLAVGVLHEGACGCCQTRVPAGVALRIREGSKYYFCENCLRFILPEPSES